MNAPAVAPSAQTGTFKLYRHVVIGLAVALIAPFTGLAWPFAILLGIVIGQDDIDRRRHVARSSATKVLRVLAVTGGVGAMMFFGAIFGGLIAFLIVALTAISERAAADGEPVDRIVARLILFALPILAYVVLIVAGASISIRFGA